MQGSEIHIQGWFSTGSYFASKGTLDNIWRHIWLLQLRVGGLLTSSEYRPEMPLNILQCTEQPTTNDLVPNTNSSEATEPWQILSHPILTRRVVLMSLLCR